MKKIRNVLSLLVILAVLTLIPDTQSYAAEAPDKVKSVKTQVVNMSENTQIVLTWKKAAGAIGYRVFLVDGTTGQRLSRVASTKKTTVTVKNLTPGTRYYFQVYAYNSEGKGPGSSIVTAKTTNWLRTVHKRYFVVTVTSATTVKTASGKTIRIPKNTKIVAHTRTTVKKKIKATLSDGTVITISNTKLRYGNVKTTTEYYSQTVKESFVNKKNYSSSTDYLIWINQYTCNTTIFKGSRGKWVQVRSMPCVIGNGGKTSVGTFKLLKQDAYRNKPRVYFTWNPAKNWGQAFHCRKDSNTRAAVSDGCIRLADSDLYYLVANCPLGTTIVSY